MRARKAKTSPNFELDHLPKEGKLDSVCAAVSNAIWLSGGIRHDTIFHAVLEGPHHPPKVVTFIGSEIRGLRHDERSVAGYIKFALEKGRELVLNQEIHVRSGIRVAKKSFERLAWEYHEKGFQMLVLDEKGSDIRDFSFAKPFVVMFGGPFGFPGKSERTFADIRARKICLGPKKLFASHCPVIVNNELDRRNI